MGCCTSCGWCPWRDMHERYGKWTSVYVRFRRWAEQGVGCLLGASPPATIKRKGHSLHS
nr:transposase [Rhizobium sullae]